MILSIEQSKLGVNHFKNISYFYIPKKSIYLEPDENCAALILNYRNKTVGIKK